ncbi:IclR family transcriptional regulator domain-containing protein [Nocardia sp. NBC_01327]|uniref:IclR family transcriptional regulator domain-containing protein n=1 Tax=Nocardia sp. NBC_01327 TaxID=2903593 RepID=UPI002E0EE672|nr:helix-turn-helix domain-containing protein [Nocardia sp. NBC_01327]
MSDDHTVVGRVVAITDAIAAAAGPLTLAALTHGTGIPKPTVRRIANDLVRHHVLEATPAGYRLGPRLSYYGFRAGRAEGLSVVVPPYLRDLSLRAHGEVSWCGEFFRGELDFRQLVFGHEYRADISSQTWPSSALLGPSFALTAGGRLQSAFDDALSEQLAQTGCRPLTRYSATAPRELRLLLEQARATGLAYEREQVTLGWSCVAAVILDAEERPLGVIGLTGRSSVAAQRSTQRALIAAADAIGRELRSARRGPRVVE